MRVSVFGLGYVGSVSAAALAADGHEVVGVGRDRRAAARFPHVAWVIADLARLREFYAPWRGKHRGLA